MRDPLEEYKVKIGIEIDLLAKEIHGVVRKMKIPCIVRYRVKNKSTLLKKMKINEVLSVFNIRDVYGFRIIVKKEEDIFKVTESLKRQYCSKIHNDFITNPKTRPDIYHLKGKMLRCMQLESWKNDCMFEIQITTINFHRHNEPLHDEYHQEKYGNL